MSQYDFGDLESPLPGASFINGNLEPWRDALHSCHKGDSRPSYAVAGMLWIDDSADPDWLVKIFDGVDDITLGTIDTTANTFSISGIIPANQGGAGTVNGIMKANGSGTVSAATAGTDYVAPGTATVFTRQQNFSNGTLTDGANISWDLSQKQSTSVTLAGNRTLDNPTNQVANGTYILRVVQDGSGGHTLAYGSAYKWPGGTEPVLSTTAGAVDILTFISDGTNMYGVAQTDFQ